MQFSKLLLLLHVWNTYSDGISYFYHSAGTPCNLIVWRPSIACIGSYYNYYHAMSCLKINFVIEGVLGRLCGRARWIY